MRGFGGVFFLQKRVCFCNKRRKCCARIFLSKYFILAVMLVLPVTGWTSPKCLKVNLINVVQVRGHSLHAPKSYSTKTDPSSFLRIFPCCSLLNFKWPMSPDLFTVYRWPLKCPIKSLHHLEQSGSSLTFPNCPVVHSHCWLLNTNLFSLKNTCKALVLFLNNQIIMCNNLWNKSPKKANKLGGGG